MPAWFVPGSGLLAAVFAIIDLWRVADRFWPAGRWWSASLIGTDVALASTMVYALPAMLPVNIRHGFEYSILLPIICGAIAGRILYAVPIHSARTAATRIMTLRKFLLREIELRGRSSLVLYVVDTAQPAGDAIGPSKLKEFAKLIVQDWARRNPSIPLDRLAEEILGGGKTAWDTDELMSVIIKYGGLPACAMVVNAARINTLTLTPSAPGADFCECSAGCGSVNGSIRVAEGAS